MYFQVAQEVTILTSINNVSYLSQQLPVIVNTLRDTAYFTMK